MDFETLRTDKTQLMNKHFLPGRNGRAIEGIVRHHNAGVLTTEQCWLIWQERPASAHYQVEVDGTIGRLVNDWDTALHAANLERNKRTIGIEHSNYGGAKEDWPISQATIKAGAHLAGALCSRHGLGRPVFGVNIFDHLETAQTVCPLHLANGGKYHDQWMREANAWYAYHETLRKMPALFRPVYRVAFEVSRRVQGW